MYTSDLSVRSVGCDSADGSLRGGRPIYPTISAVTTASAPGNGSASIAAFTSVA